MLTPELAGCLFFASLAFLHMPSLQLPVCLRINICVCMSSVSYENNKQMAVGSCQINHTALIQYAHIV